MTKKLADQTLQQKRPTMALASDSSDIDEGEDEEEEVVIALIESESESESDPMQSEQTTRSGRRCTTYKGRHFYGDSD